MCGAGRDHCVSSERIDVLNCMQLGKSHFKVRTSICIYTYKLFQNRKKIGLHVVRHVSSGDNAKLAYPHTYV